MYRITITFEYDCGGFSTKEIAIFAFSSTQAVAKAKEEFYLLLQVGGKIPDGHLFIDRVIWEKT